MNELLHPLGLVGTAVFAASGVLAAGRKDMDFLGVTVLATVTAIGGGTIRDLMINRHPLFWLTDTSYLLAIFSTVVVMLALLPWLKGKRHLPTSKIARESRAGRLPTAIALWVNGFLAHKNTLYRLLLVADALGLALFSILGAQIAQAQGFSPLIMVLMGTITGTAGGVLRDMLCAEVPILFRKEVYATAAVVGIGVYIVADMLLSHSWAFMLGFVVILSVRLLSIWHDFNFPTIRL